MSEEVHKVHSKEEAQKLAEQLGKAIKYEIIPKHPEQMTSSTSTQRKIFVSKWFGKVANNVEATIRLNNNLLSDPKVKCRCGAFIDLSKIADYECGSKLGIALKFMEEYFRWGKKWNALNEKASVNKILLDKFFEEEIKLWAQYQKNMKDWGSKEVSYTATATCPKCLTTIGQMTVTLRVIGALELTELTKTQLLTLEVSNEMLAYASKRMRFGSIEQLKEWLNSKDAEQAKEILRKTITELSDLELPYETSKITQTLTTLIGEIDKTTHERKIEFVNTVEMIAKERIQIIT